MGADLSDLTLATGVAEFVEITTLYAILSKLKAWNDLVSPVAPVALKYT